MGVEELRRALLARLEALDEIRVAAFYSDVVVSEVLGALYERWEKAGRRGEPIDYATEDELVKLLSRLEEVESKPVWALARELGIAPGA